MAKRKYNDSTSSVETQDIDSSQTVDIDVADDTIDEIAVISPVTSARAYSAVIEKDLEVNHLFHASDTYTRSTPADDTETPTNDVDDSIPVKEISGEELIIKIGEETKDPREYVDKVYNAFMEEGFVGICLYLQEHGNYDANTYIVGENKFVGFSHLYMVLIEKNPLSTRLALRFLLALLEKSDKMFTENIEREIIIANDVFLKKSRENTVRLMLILNVLLGKSTKYTTKSVKNLIDSMKVSTQCTRDIYAFCNTRIDM